MAEFTKERIIEELKASTQNASGMFEIGEETICNLMSLLTNAAPQLPQPAVPDEMQMPNTLSMYAVDAVAAIAEVRGWNACRAAMLQGAEPVSQPYKLPDDTRRLDWLDAQNKRLNDYYGTAYGWKFDAYFQRNAMMLNDSNYPVMTVRQAIDEAMAAAPQQEADNG